MNSLKQFAVDIWKFHAHFFNVFDPKDKHFAILDSLYCKTADNVPAFEKPRLDSNFNVVHVLFYCKLHMTESVALLYHDVNLVSESR